MGCVFRPLSQISEPRGCTWAGRKHPCWCARRKTWALPFSPVGGAPSLAKALRGPLCGCLMGQPQVFLQQLISFNTNQSVFIPKRLIFSKKKKKTLVRKEWMKKEENNQGSEKKEKQSPEVKHRNTLVHTHKRKWEDCAKLESSWLSTEGRYCSSLSNCCHGKRRSSVARSWSLSRKVRNLHSYMTSPNF